MKRFIFRSFPGVRNIERKVLIPEKRLKKTSSFSCCRSGLPRNTLTLHSGPGHFCPEGSAPEFQTVKTITMEQLNRIELRGIVGSSNVRTVGDKRVARFSLATDYIYKGKGGEPVIETTWHNIQAWEGKNIPDVTIIGKGSGVYVTGRYRIQRYQAPDGTEKTSYEVLADKVTILDEPPQLQSNR